MRSLSFLLVTYYAVLSLFVTQNCPRHVLPSLHIHSSLRVGARTIKNCVVGETQRKEMQRQNERTYREKLLIQRPKALNGGGTNSSLLRIIFRIILTMIIFINMYIGNLSRIGSIIVIS